MSQTDFPRAVARVSEGMCPLCDGELVDAVLREELREDTSLIGEYGWCSPCAIGCWTSRTPTRDEIKRLHDRGDEN